MRDAGADQRYGHQMLFSVFHALADGFGDFRSLADAYADATFFVADNKQRSETEVAAAEGKTTSWWVQHRDDVFHAVEIVALAYIVARLAM